MVSSKTAPFFIPPLSLQLEAKEKEIGRPLSQSEVESIRDRAPCIQMEVADRQEMFRDRGYSDLDPENVWQEWIDYKADPKGLKV